MVVNALIENLSKSNKDDLHKTLNASTILCEFAENESFFQILTQPEVVRNIVNVVISTDANSQNQSYALNFLTQIITQYCEQDISFFKNRKEETLDTIMDYFPDLCYNALLILRGGNTQATYVN